MQRIIGLLLAIYFPAGPALPQDKTHAMPAELERGIRQVNEGDLQSGIITLDEVIQRLGADPSADSGHLSQALLYKGIALVGLKQEEPAKVAFREALKYEPSLRLEKGSHPDRVVRVFEAARTGKTKSVIERPSAAPKKAGIGTGVILAVVGGVALAGGAAVAIAGSDESLPSVSDIDIELLGSSPPSGSTISLRDALRGDISAPPVVAVRVTSQSKVFSGFVRMTLNSSGTRCLEGSSGAATIQAGSSNQFPVSFWRALSSAGVCAPPFTVTSTDTTYLARTTSGEFTAVGSVGLGGAYLNFTFVP